MFKSLSRCFGTTSQLLKQSGVTKAEKHLDYLKHYYNPELLESIKLTESVVDPKDYLNLQLQGREGKSKVAPKSTFDYSTTDPEWKEPILYPNQGLGRTPYPEIPQVPSPDRGDLRIRFSNAPRAPNDSPQSSTAVKNTSQIARELSQLTGLDEKYIRNLYIRPLVMKRVSLKTAKGNIANFFVMSVAGDKNGMLGIGIGKSRDGIRTAATKAHWNAVKNLTPIKRYDNRTILGSFELKYHATKLKFKSAPIGFGLRCNRNIFEICQAAGIKDLRGKVHKSRNPVLVAQGFFKALTQQKSIEELALNRGKKVVELRKVYYSN
ncbi:MRPS5 [Candida theae]|uniref:Small ribosomal subunit protein uS5m n=1 Tax=Candida theae TaxID=1198502 RepID=A0AAD5BDL3_9ASCO|nr:MRPS5 [Candida theae]KAI5955546.1 MRPS5 [Candida theae]